MGFLQVPHEEEIVDVLSSWPASSWRANAACSGMNPDLFFPERGDVLGVARAKAICLGCPVTAECLQFALEAKEKQGIWGGLSGQERRAIRSARRRERDAACSRQMSLTGEASARAGEGWCSSSGSCRPSKQCQALEDIQVGEIGRAGGT
jgi:WhiB family redox-sensing transcriptional regulator